MNFEHLQYTLQPATVWFLEMRENPHIELPGKAGIIFTKLSKPVPADEYRKYYYGVGFKWQWLDRLVMPDEELHKKINADNIEIFVMQENGADAGYAEFMFCGQYTEVVYFGLMTDFIGRGYGKYFIQWVIQKAWSYNPQWIRLNTCSLDHPNALSNYKKAGFVVVDIKTEERKMLV